MTGHRRITKMRQDEALRVAVELHQDGHIEEARELYRRILEASPGQPDALHYLGVSCHQLGDFSEAEALVRRAIEAAPGYADAHNNLGNILEEQGKLEEAEAAYREAIARSPGHAGALNNLGVALRLQGRLEEAEKAFRFAIGKSPRHADAHHNLAIVLENLGQREEAISIARRAIELEPGHPNACRNLAESLQRAGRTEEAIEVLRQLEALRPDDAIAGHLMAAYGAGEIPARASDAYVRETFDEFAASFDAVLEGLSYRAPDLVAGAVRNEWPSPEGRLDVLDAGCGTGLCAPFLRAYACRLTGVDLSRRMIARARRRNLYDDLVEQELTRYLREAGREFDLIACTDTLVYFGDLSLFMPLARGRLRPGGRLVFTVEKACEPGPEPGYLLGPTGRYLHARPYILETLARSGFTLRAANEAILRKERGEPVLGLVVTASA